VAPETFDSLEKANHEVLEAILANLRWLRRLRVKKYWLDPQPQILYNNILDSREGLNEYQAIGVRLQMNLTSTYQLINSLFCE
jgi:hypothetical protein